MERKHVLIVDDHPLIREGIKTILQQNETFIVIGEAESGEEALQKVKELKPDLVVLDITLPGMSGIEVAAGIKQNCPEVKIVMVTVHSRVNYIKEAFRAGAMGYIVKESTAERLIECLEAVSRGQYYVDASLSDQIIDGFLAHGGPVNGADEDGYSTLTDREQQVFRLMAQGLRTKDMAKQLEISPKTVEAHRARLMSKLNLHTPLEVIRYAAQIGLIEMDSE